MDDFVSKGFLESYAVLSEEDIKTYKIKAVWTEDSEMRVGVSYKKENEFHFLLENGKAVSTLVLNKEQLRNFEIFHNYAINIKLNTSFVKLAFRMEHSEEFDKILFVEDFRSNFIMPELVFRTKKIVFTPWFNDGQYCD